MSPKVVVNQSNMKVVVNKNNNTVEVTSPGPQGNFYNSYKGNWSSATAYILGDIVFYNGSSYVAIANNTNSQPPSANWSAVAKGIPGGGTTGQIIVKNSATDYDYSWTNNYTINTTSPLTGGAAINTNPTLAINATANDTANYVVQRDANQSFAIGAVRFDTSSVQTTAVGKLYWDGNETLNLGLGSTGTVTIAVGQEVINYVTNAEATTLNVGEVVYLFGAQGDRPSVKRASNTSDATSAKTFGIVAESITAGGAGFVVNKGIVSKVNTSAYNPGDILWLGATAGTFTTTKPVAPNHLVFVGVVLRSNAGNGLVYVAPQNGYELEEIHDVLITSPTDGQFLTYESSTDLWKNKGISATAPITYNAGTRTIAANAASTSAAGVVQLSDSTSTTSSVLASTPTATKAAYDLAAAAIPLSQKAAANGVATLDASGLVPTNQLPALAITNTFVVASQAAMLALTAETGDVAVRTDLNKSFILTATPASTLANWQELLTPPDAVSSVDGRTGTVTLSDLYAARGTTISTTAPLAGGGDLSANRTLSLNIGSSLTTSASNLIVDSTVVPYLANANTFTAAQTATSFIVTGSTVPANGIYLPAANTLGFATNSAKRVEIGSTGGINVFSQATTANDLITLFGGVATAGGSVSIKAWARGSGTAINGSSAITFGSSTGPSSYIAFSVFTGGAETEKLRVSTQGNTLINTTTDSLGSSGTLLAQLGVVAGAATTVGAVIRGAASQTANLTEWQDSSGNVLTRINAAGIVAIGGVPRAVNLGLVPTLQVEGTTASSSYAMIMRNSNDANSPRFTLAKSRGTTVGSVASVVNSDILGYIEYQGADGTNMLLSSRIEGAVDGAVSSNIVPGRLSLYTADSTGTLYERLRVNAAGLVLINSTSSTLGSGSAQSQLGLVSAAATTVGMVIRGAASQTADLTQWQNSAGTVVANLNPTGVLFVPSVRSTSGTAIAELDLSAGLLVRHSTAANTALRVQNTNASPSGDLQQFLDTSGNILNSIDNSGNIRSEAQLIQYGAEGSLIQNIPTRVHPAETLLKQAVWWIDAAHTSASSQTINNLGWGGSALNVTNGSSTSADSNDAQYLAWDGINYVYTPGVGANFLTVPDANNLDITGDIDLRAFVALDDWTPTAENSLIGKRNANMAYAIGIHTDGTIRLAWSADGSTFLNAYSTVATGVTDGTVKWVRATLDVDNGAAGRSIQFFLSDNGTTWTQLGSTVTQAGTTSIAATIDAVGIGAYSSSANVTAGKIYRAQILNGIDGVPVLDVDCSQITSGSATSFTALTGQTVTINRATSGRKTVAVTNPLWLFGTDDYMEVNNRWLEHTGSNYLYLPGVASNYASAPDSAALDITGDIDLRVKVAMDDWTPAANQSLICKSSGASNISYRFFLRSDGLLQLNWSADGTAAGIAGIASTAVTGVADGATKWVRVTFDVDNGASGKTVTFFTSDDGSTWTQLGNAVTQAGTTSIFAGTASQEIGTRDSGTGEIARGKFFRAQVLNGINGTVAFDANFETGITSNLPTTFTESSANAATVTINYSGTGYRSAGVIASTYVYPGNPNTFKLSTTSLLDFGATDSFTIFAVSRVWGSIALNGRIIDKADGNSKNGYIFYYQTGSSRFAFLINDFANATATAEAASTITSGALNTTAGVINRTTQLDTVFNNGTAGTSVSTASVGSIRYPSTIFRIGVGTVAAYADMEFMAGAVFRRALTAAEIATLNNYFQGRVA